MHVLTQQLIEAGLIQFGLFETGPIRFNLHLLPAYPDILANISQQIAKDFIDILTERILSPADSIPLGVACSLASNVPMVYSRGSDDPPVWDLVGAYDVGHPTVLIANINDDPTKIRQLIERAGRVGLDVDRSIGVIGIWPDAMESSLLYLPEIIDEIEAAKRLPSGQASAVRQWIAQGLVAD